MPAVLNAANEVAVGRFLAREIGFADVARTIESAMHAFAQASHGACDDVAGLLGADAWARTHASAYETRLEAVRA
jgi:1-deoxy-D-xylulose-5-phosphate reductoisomerase